MGSVDGTRTGAVQRAVKRILFSIGAAGLASHAAVADQLARELEFRIASQRLATGLSEFSDQAGIQIISAGRAIERAVTSGIEGKYPAERALEALLRGTGLSYRIIDDHTVSIFPTRVRLSSSEGDRLAAGSSSAPAAGSESEQGQSPGNATDEGGPLEEVVVTGLTFRYNEVESANKMPLAIKDTPQSVKVITEDLLDFAGITKLEDFYKLDAGAQTSNAQDGFVRTYFRGFRLDYDKALKIDGIRTPGRVAPDLSPFERFEIVKGPTSTLYGQAQVAGTLNAISKKPRADAGGSVSLETGSFNHYRGEFDAYGALTGDERLTSRLVASYLDEDTFLDYGFNKRAVIAPSLKYQFTPQTSATLLLQYQDVRFNGSYGFGAQYIGPVDGGATEPDGRTAPNDYAWPDVPRSRLVGFPDATPERQLTFAHGLLEHQFANHWQLRANLLFTRSKIENKGAYSGAVEPDGETPLYMYFADNGGQAYAGDVNLFGDFELLGRKHTLFFGVDYSHDKKTGLVGFRELPAGSFNIFHPDYAALPSIPSEVAAFLGLDGGVNRDRTLYREQGVTVQAFLHPTDRLSLLLGARYSDFKLSYVNVCCDASALQPLPSGFGGDANTAADDNLTFQFGATYRLTPAVNAYLSYGETFLPRNEFVRSATDPTIGVRTPPEEGKSYEAGLKGEVLDRRLSWSVAAFQIARTNVSEDDPDDDIFGYVVLRGEQRSRGVEVELQGEIRRGWSIYGSFATIDNKFTKGEFAGFYSFIAPKFGASVYTAYELQQGPLAGLGFGGGVVYKQRGDINQFGDNGRGLFFDRLFPDTVEVDTRVFYRRNAWTFQVSALNLFDEKYYSPVNNNFSSSVSVNPPRTFLGKVTYDFGKQ